MTQEVMLLKLSDLVLWTENPRDPIRADAKDQDIVDKALSDTHSKWGLPKLAKEMGEFYDLSELPTIVFHGQHPVVYDGNRRVVLGKIKIGQVRADGLAPAELPTFPEEIPCNVCSKGIALTNVLRKHADSGSWLPLERDIFLHKHMKRPKSPFLVLEERTGIISANPYMNQRFVKEEIFREDVLEKIGLQIDGDTFHSRHTSKETAAILADIARKVRDKVISTRNNRGDVVGVLDSSTQEILATNQTKKFRDVKESKGTFELALRQTQTRRTRPKEPLIFGGPLYLQSGDVNNFYRDLADLYNFYVSNKQKFSQSFPSVIRMALRLLVETAAQDIGENLATYVKNRFKNAKAALNQDQKTTLSAQSVTEGSIVALLQMGAHNYASASNIDQSMAVSLVLGGILTNSHGKAPSK
ncbi:hypothetical protein [Janthinobacterium lividum]|uniref:Uncharacterized protein n=1 Tax=Janthinobacterium lividum TaxID=29581 RepID=A0ABU0XT62_9BURK|nr:hypothetical protein [Janthinobacterium lividum]MDQ4626708.1 hypothetical protein [Janthinobacterium lividum]MDQ4674325.1 hypothetical protein [Janthinobacterium lividum]MDQ4685056.1 hypothetical protein [Janthinobacterium lividum]